MADIVSVAQNARSSARSFWSGLSQTQRAAIYTVGVLGVGLLALFVLWAKNPAYSVAYSGLTEQNAGAVVAKLKELNVPYKLEVPGTILVPSEQVQDVRLQMAMAKLPEAGGVGYELFDQTNFGLTDFAQRVNYQRALEGELSRTIGKIEGVESARVHIVIPEQSLFSEAKKDTTASVILQLRPGVKLSKAQMQGISRLVAGSVEGLKEANLTVVDTRGNTLSVTADANGLDSDVFQTRADAQTALETNLESNIRSLLDKTLGPNKTAVQVRATLDWDKVEQANETYSPDGLQPQVRSQRKLVEDYPGGARAGAGGIPGVGSNVPTYQAELATPTITGTPVATGTPAAGSVAANANGYREESTINYELSKKTEKVTRAPGSLARLSVAVAADSASFTADQVAEIKSLVSSAAGIDAKRGDVLTVSLMPFDKTTQAAAETTDSTTTQLLGGVKTFAPIVGPLLLFFVLWLFLRRSGGRAGSIRVSEVPLPKGLTASQVAQYRLATQNTLGASSAALEAPKLTEKDIERQTVQKQISTLARENPAMLTQLIQTWIEEDK